MLAILELPRAGQDGQPVPQKEDYPNKDQMIDPTTSEWF